MHGVGAYLWTKPVLMNSNPLETHVPGCFMASTIVINLNYSEAIAIRLAIATLLDISITPQNAN